MRKFISLSMFLLCSLALFAGLTRPTLQARAAMAASGDLLAFTDTPTFTPTLLPTDTETPTPTPTGVPTDTPTPTATGLPTDTPTPTATGSQPPSPTPGPIVVDPLITKAVNLSQVVQGDRVDFDITVSNPNTVNVANVVVTDPLPAVVDFISATTSQGTFVYDAATHTLTFNLGTLTPGQVVAIQIVTRVNALAQAPDQIRNTARLCHDNNQCLDSNTTLSVIVPGQLPGAGVGPGLWEIGVMLALGLSVSAGLGGLWRARRQRA